ncbi:MAG: (Fe-S)-binding protein [Elusimicrobiaceae bacterium]|nr:(Fe-S)-binding protein [Elusimicrobiaceae bacterium]
MTDVPHLYDYTALYEPKDTPAHLGALLTGQGARSLYDSVCQCNRCGYCAQVCPTFRLTGREGESARGRNQLMRMLMNGRLRASESGAGIGRLLDDCLLCGACERACFTAVRTPLHVWEGLRVLGIKRFPAGLRRVLRRLATDRESMRGVMRVYNLMRKAAGMFRRGGSSDAGVPAGAVLGRPRLRFLELHETEQAAPENAACIYFASCSEEYVSPETGSSALLLIRTFVGWPVVMSGNCCGFYAFMAGDIEAARAALGAVIEKYEKISGSRELPLVCACADCAGFLRMAEQLFSESDEMRPRAARLAANVREVAELMAPEFFEPQGCGEAAPLVATGHFPAGLGRSAKTAACAETLLDRIFGSGYHPHRESAMPSGAYGGYPFVNIGLANRLLRRKAENIAGVQASLTVTATVAEAEWIGAGLRRYCAGAGAAHYCVVLRNCVQEKFHADKI